MSINKYEDAKRMVEDAGLIGKNDGFPDIHYQEIAHLLVEVKQLRDSIERAISTLRSQPNDLEDGPDYHRELLSFLDGAICHAIDVLEGKE